MKKTSILFALVNILLLCNSINAQNFIKNRPSEEKTIFVYEYTGGIMSGIVWYEYLQNIGESGPVIVSAAQAINDTITVTTGEIMRIIIGYKVSTERSSQSDITEVQLKLSSAGGIQNFTQSISPTYTQGSSIYIPTPPPGHWITTSGYWTKVKIDSCVSITSALLTSSALVQLPKTVSSLQSYPNPFNPSTIISFNLVSKSFVTLKIFDFTGREVSTLVSEELPTGNHLFHWNAENFLGGVYFYNLKAGTFTETKKILLVK